MEYVKGTGYIFRGGNMLRELDMFAGEVTLPNLKKNNNFILERGLLKKERIPF